MQDQLTLLQKQGLQLISDCQDLEKLKEIEVELLGRKGQLTELLKQLKDLPSDIRPAAGQQANEVKVALMSALQSKQGQLENENIKDKLENERIDVTEPAIPRRFGHIHPISQVQKEVEQIFSSMGYLIVDGPEVESEYYNFEALNIPSDHPARDMQDTFFVDQEAHPEHGHLVLRTHTSPVQIRAMQHLGAPLRMIVPGRVFRYEATDATHDATFNQVEGLLIDKDISLADLKGTLTEFLSRLFKYDVKIRFRPGYFPFVEPGLEVDFSCRFCSGNGCRVCKYTGWIEFMGAGMIHPNVLAAGGIDSDVYQGWAFGFGLTRLVMMRYNIDDIRLLYNNDLRFVEQF